VTPEWNFVAEVLCGIDIRMGRIKHSEDDDLLSGPLNTNDPIKRIHIFI